MKLIVGDAELEPTSFGSGDSSYASDHIKEVTKNQGNFTPTTRDRIPPESRQRLTPSQGRNIIKAGKQERP